MTIVAATHAAIGSKTEASKNLAQPRSEDGRIPSPPRFEPHLVMPENVASVPVPPHRWDGGDPDKPEPMLSPLAEGTGVEVLHRRREHGRVWWSSRTQRQ